MIFHQILSDPVSDFGKGPKRGVKKNNLDLYSAKEGLIRSTKIQFKNLKFGIGVDLT